MKNEARKSLDFVSIFLVLVISFFLFTICKVCYLEPDDYLFAGILGGAYGTDENQFLVHPYVSVILTYILYFIGKVLNIFNIYGIFLMFAFTYIYGILHIIAERSGAGPELHCYLFVLQVLNGFYLSYTVMAYLAVGTAILWSFVLDREGSKRKGEQLGICGLAIVGVLLRREVILTVGLLLLPVLVDRIINKKNSYSIKCCLAVVITFILASVVNESAYKYSDIWNSYLKWNTASTSIRDFAQIDQNKYASILGEIGWSENDLALVYAWAYIDQTTFGREKLEHLAADIELKDRYNVDLIEIMSLMIRQKSVLAYMAVALIILCICVHYKRERKRDFSLIILSVLMPFILMAALFVRQRYVERISVSFLLLGVLQLLIIAGNGDRENEKGRRLGCVIGFVIAISLPILILIEPAIRRNQNSIQDGYNVIEVKDYVAQNKDKLFLVDAGLGNRFVTGIPIIKLEKEDYCSNILKLGSWDSYSGRYYSLLEEYEIDDPNNMFAELAIDNKVYLLTNNAWYCESLTTYLMEKYGWRIVIQQIKEFDISRAGVFDYGIWNADLDEENYNGS